MKDIKIIRYENKLTKIKPNHTVKYTVIGTVLFLLLFFGSICGKNLFIWFVSSLPIEQPVVEYKDPFKEALKNIELKTSWKNVNLSSVDSLYMDIDVYNKNSQALNSFEITCSPDYGSAVINNNKVTIFESIPIQGHVKLSDYNFGKVNYQVKSVSCSVTDANFKK